MLSPQNVIYGFCKTTHPPKYKYLISLHRSTEINVVACLTTSQNRSGVPSVDIKHGKTKNNDGEIISYVFMPDMEVGDSPDGSKFKFPKQTVIRFDYCFKEDGQEKLLFGFDSPTIVCKLSDREYENLIYAMYQSEDTPEVYKPYFENILAQLGKRGSISD